MLSEHLAYIEQQQAINELPSKVEIILVDDGSRDKTLEFVTKMTAQY
jgi:glycosyltransferase involved in cell wall biosynthesis